MSTNRNGANFSSDRKYRYALWRIWDTSLPLVMFVGLNPSTANESNNDPTIKRVVSIAKKLGYGGVYMMNLFGLVSPDPKALLTCGNPVGHNDYWLQLVSSQCKDIIAAWGNFKIATERAQRVMLSLPPMKALHINKNGSPKHPLYCKSDIVPVPFKIQHSKFNI